jgi:hypothetical protein
MKTRHYQNCANGATRVTGNHLARAKKLTKRERADLAIEIINGQVELGPLTDGQIARICGVSPSYVCSLMRMASVPVQLAAE